MVWAGDIFRLVLSFRMLTATHMLILLSLSADKKAQPALQYFFKIPIDTDGQNLVNQTLCKQKLDLFFHYFTFCSLCVCTRTRLCVCVRACVFPCVCVHASVRACVCVCVCEKGAVITKVPITIEGQWLKERGRGEGELLFGAVLLDNII